MRTALTLGLALILLTSAASAAERTFQGKPAAEWAAMLNDADAGTRLQAITALVEIGDGTDRKALAGKVEGLLEDKETTVRVRAARWLAESGSKSEKIVTTLIPVIQSLNVPLAVRVEGVTAVAGFGASAKAALPAIQKLQEDLRASGENKPDSPLAADYKTITDAIAAISSPQKP